MGVVKSVVWVFHAYVESGELGNAVSDKLGPPGH